MAKEEPQAPDVPEDEDEDVLPPKQYARSDILSAEGDWAPTYLRVRKTWVRVRRLPVLEVARLSYLPDIMKFTEMVREQLAKEEARRLEEEGNREERRAAKKRNQRQEAFTVEDEDLAEQDLIYKAHLAHLSVLAFDEAEDEDYVIPDPVPCKFCSHGKRKVKHPPSLWTPKQTAYLMMADLNIISEVALGARSLEAAAIPFPEDQPDEDSPEPVSSGESTPPTS